MTCLPLWSSPPVSQLLVDQGEWDPEDDVRIEKNRQKVKAMHLRRRQEEKAYVEGRRKKNEGVEIKQ